MPFGPRTEEQCKAFVADAIEHRQADPRTQFDFAVVVASTGEVIGGCDLGLRFGEGRRDAELGYIYRRSSWGNGYATEAARAMLQLSFERLGVHRVFATCDVANDASARVLEKVGMRQEGLLVSSFQNHQAEWRDHHVYAIVESEWNAGDRNA